MTDTSKFEIQVIKSRSKPGVMVVSVAGKVHATCGAELSAAIAKQARVGRRQFVIDLSEATTATPKGLGEVKTTLTRLKGQGCAFTMAGVKGDAWQVVDTVGLDNVAPCYPDVRDATKAL